MSELITGQKTAQQLDAMREGGKILARIFDDIRGFVHAGQTEQEIDAFVASKIAEYGATATYKTSEVNFPGAICISTNDEIVHGVPSDYTLRQGDVVSFDLVITYKEMKTDAAFTMNCGWAVTDRPQLRHGRVVASTASVTGTPSPLPGRSAPCRPREPRRRRRTRPRAR